MIFREKKFQDRLLNSLGESMSITGIEPIKELVGDMDYFLRKFVDHGEKIKRLKQEPSSDICVDQKKLEKQRNYEVLIKVATGMLNNKGEPMAEQVQAVLEEVQEQVVRAIEVQEQGARAIKA